MYVGCYRLSIFGKSVLNEIFNHTRPSIYNCCTFILTSLLDTTSEAITFVTFIDSVDYFHIDMDFVILRGSRESE